MLRKFRERAQEERGFTLIELLVVILIIGILAAIAIPSFINQRTKGQDAKAKSGVTTAAQAIETCATDNNGKYGSCNNQSTLENIEPTLKDYTMTFGTFNDTDYSVTVASDSGADGGGSFTISKASGATTRSCANAGKGGCQSGGTW